MFVGHYALGLRAKQPAPRTSLGALIAAPFCSTCFGRYFSVAGWEYVSIQPNPNPFLRLQFVTRIPFARTGRSESDGRRCLLRSTSASRVFDWRYHNLVRCR
jgi:hypothetical protein